VYVDGAADPRLSLNERASKTTHLNVVGRWGWAVTGSHSIKIVNVASSGHPRFDIDGVVVFQ
jgi:hypothetical protein